MRRGLLGTVDRRVMARVAEADSVVLDRVLPALGRSANYGRLWWATSGVLVLTGQSRAALRGLGSLALASFTANVLSKQLIGRKRPSVAAIPLRRRLRRPPVGTSFPSGHSASAAAFTTGVALESPVAAVPIGVLAIGVAASRVATGAHYPSDVLAGVALGVGSGLLSRWWWPRVRAAAW